MGARPADRRPLRHVLHQQARQQHAGARDAAPFRTLPLPLPLPLPLTLTLTLAVTLVITLALTLTLTLTLILTLNLATGPTDSAAGHRP